MIRQLKLTEVAQRLGVSEKTARRYVKSGVLPSVFVGNAYRVSEKDLEDYLESARVTPGKAQAPPSQRSLFNGLEEERRLHYLKPWAGYVSALANRVDHEIEQGHVKDLVWWQEFNNDVLTLTLLYNRILPLPAEQSEDERLELLKFGKAIDRLNDVADKMYRAMEPVMAEQRKQYYARERERRKAAFNAIPRRRSA